MLKLREVVIVSACRTAIGSFGGVLKDVPTAKLSEAVMKEAVKRAKIDKAIIGKNPRAPRSCYKKFSLLQVILSLATAFLMSVL